MRKVEYSEKIKNVDIKFGSSPSYFSICPRLGENPRILELDRRDLRFLNHKKIMILTALFLQSTSIVKILTEIFSG